MDNIELLNELSKRFNNYDYTISEIQTYEAYLFAVAYYYYVMLQTQNKIKQKDICKLYNMDVSKFSRLANNCENGIFKNEILQRKYEVYCTIIKEYYND